MSPEFETALVGALAVGALSVLAGVVRQAMWNRNGFRLSRHEGRIGFLQAQISELYSPLLGLLYESTAYYDTLHRLTAQLNSSGMPPEEAELAADAVEQRFTREYFEPLRMKTVELLCAKRHLIVEDRFPQYLQDFMVHATEWEARSAVLKELGPGLNLNGLSAAKWPREIIGEVEHTLYSLRQEYRRELRSVGKLAH